MKAIETEYPIIQSIHQQGKKEFRCVYYFIQSKNLGYKNKAC